MSTTEFALGTEVCTAMINLENELGGADLGPIAIGFYHSEELWIECEDHRINLPLRHLKDIIKQIKRAERIAIESGEQS